MALRLDYEGGDTYIVDANGKRLVKIEGDQSSHHEIAAVFMDAVDAWYPMAKKQIDAVAAQVDGMYLKPTNIYGSMPGSDNTLDYISNRHKAQKILDFLKRAVAIVDGKHAYARPSTIPEQDFIRIDVDGL